MSNQLADRIHAALNRELIKRSLVRYFKQKGFGENFNRNIYPPTVQDMAMMVPCLFNKIEVAPHVRDIDLQTGIVTLGWNIFVLGNKRIYLGESTHTSLNEVKASIAGPLNNQFRSSARSTTPKRIIEFITSVLSGSKSGDVSTRPQVIGTNAPIPLGMGDSSGFFRKSQRPVF